MDLPWLAEQAGTYARFSATYLCPLGAIAGGLSDEFGAGLWGRIKGAAFGAALPFVAPFVVLLLIPWMFAAFMYGAATEGRTPLPWWQKAALGAGCLFAAYAFVLQMGVRG